MQQFHVYVTERNLVTWAVDAPDEETAKRSYRANGVRVSCENGEDEVDGAVPID